MDAIQNTKDATVKRPKNSPRRWLAQLVEDLEHSGLPLNHPAMRHVPDAKESMRLQDQHMKRARSLSPGRGHALSDKKKGQVKALKDTKTIDELIRLFKVSRSTIYRCF